MTEQDVLRVAQNVALSFWGKGVRPEEVVGDAWIGANNAYQKGCDDAVIVSAAHRNVIEEWRYWQRCKRVLFSLYTVAEPAYERRVEIEYPVWMDTTDREVVRMKFEEDMTRREIARVLGEPEWKVKYRLRRVLGELRVWYGDREVGEEI